MCWSNICEDFYYIFFMKYFFVGIILRIGKEVVKLVYLSIIWLIIIEWFLNVWRCLNYYNYIVEGSVNIIWVLNM